MLLVWYVCMLAATTDMVVTVRMPLVVYTGTVAYQSCHLLTKVASLHSTRVQFLKILVLVSRPGSMARLCSYWIRYRSSNGMYLVYIHFFLSRSYTSQTCVMFWDRPTVCIHAAKILFFSFISEYIIVVQITEASGISSPHCLPGFVHGARYMKLSLRPTNRFTSPRPPLNQL